MYWSIESLHGGFSVFRVPSSYSTGRVSSIHAHGMAEPCSRNSIHVSPACSQQEQHRHWKEADGTNRVAYACSDRCTAHSATGLTGRRLCCSDRLSHLPLSSSALAQSGIARSDLSSTRVQSRRSLCSFDKTLPRGWADSVGRQADRPTNCIPHPIPVL